MKGALHSYDLVVEATGREEGFKEAIRLVKPRGALVLKSTIAQQYRLDLSSVVVNEVTVTAQGADSLSQR